MAFLDSLQNTLRTSGFNDQAVAEIMQAMQVLAKYNIMGLGLGLGVAAMAQMRSTGNGAPQPQQAPPQQMQPQMQQQRQPLPDEMGYNQSGGSGVLIDVMGGGGGKSFGASMIKDRPQMDATYMELEVAESVIGMVLGQKMKTINDIQMYTGTKVEARKHSNAPNGSRLITIQGEPDNIRAARVMIERVINEEQQRRMMGQRY